MAFEPSGDDKFLIAHCHVREEPLTDELKALLPMDSVFQGLTKVVLSEPVSPHGNGDDCICNSGRAPLVVTLLFMFSVCVASYKDTSGGSSGGGSAGGGGGGGGGGGV